MQLTHLGHACLLVESGDERILLDPGNLTAGWESVTGLSAIIVTHQHPDHLDQARLPALLAGNPRARLFSDVESADILRRMGAQPVVQEHGVSHGVGAVTIRGVGALHAVIHHDLPRVTNVGVVLTAEGEPSLFHTGDAQDADPGPVDIVTFALSAPWQASKEMIEHLRRLDAGIAIPVHDAGLSPAGRELYVNQAVSLGCQDRIRLLDLAGVGPTVVSL